MCGGSGIVHQQIKRIEHDTQLWACILFKHANQQKPSMEHRWQLAGPWRQPPAVQASGDVSAEGGRWQIAGPWRQPPAVQASGDVSAEGGRWQIAGPWRQPPAGQASGDVSAEGGRCKIAGASHQSSRPERVHRVRQVRLLLEEIHEDRLRQHRREHLLERHAPVEVRTPPAPAPSPPLHSSTAGRQPRRAAARCFPRFLLPSSSSSCSAASQNLGSFIRRAVRLSPSLGGRRRRDLLTPRRPGRGVGVARRRQVEALADLSDPQDEGRDRGDRVVQGLFVRAVGEHVVERLTQLDELWLKQAPQTGYNCNDNNAFSDQSIDNKPSHWVLPPGHWRLKQKICPLFHANMCKFDVEIKSGKRSEFIIIIIYHVRTTATNVAAMCAIVTIMIAQYTFQ